ncbi:abnormal spindle-like microcephaly-associated protein isoform X2 [Tenrec ecaudatus]|uniref:abnormal spindle-like microcephaly-associated protein isoform X2 n=1 Tax=Tenrec ecaudatus TaxID=94439 RepID=UPI003F5AD22A
MATRRGGRSYWELSPTERRPPARLRGPGAAEEAASPAVLSLSHFCKAPFLCFGDVRLGASRARSLTLDNPNEEAAEVKVCRFPAADRGFSIATRGFRLQPKEKIVISINWTPVKEGRVREVVTFLVNDILKHQAILLGNAEERKKKKGSLWNGNNKKTVSISSNHSKGISNSENVNETFNVFPKTDIARSPLQACENLVMTEVHSPTEQNCLVLEENRFPISPISPSSTGSYGEARLSLSNRRSTTYTSLHISEHVDVLKVEGSTILNDVNQQVISVASFNSRNNINGQTDENNRLLLTPNCSSSTLSITQSSGNFLSPDSFVRNSHIGNNEVELVTRLSSDTSLKDNSKVVHLESKSVHEIYQTILSPDSFVSDSYGLKQALESETVKPILSPTQFVKDNMAYICSSQQTCKLSPLSNDNFQAPQPPQVWIKNKVLPGTYDCQDSKSPRAIFEQPKTVGMKSDYQSFTEQNHLKFSAVQDSSYKHNEQSKKRPILSSTVTKRKSNCARKKQTETNKPKAKRCLNSTAGELEKVIVENQREKESFHSYLPIIEPIAINCNNGKSEITRSPLKTMLVTRKRKSAGHLEAANVRSAVVGLTEIQEIKRIHFSPVESNTSTAKKNKKVITPVSKHMSSRAKLNLKKRPDSLLYRTPSSKTNKRIRAVVPVAQSNLTFIKPLKTDIPRHPMPFAAKNMFYDERWKEKQEQGFTWWLNFILTPDDFTVKTSISEVNAATLLLGMESQHKISVPRAPTKDEVSLRAYTARCRLNRLRRAACRLFSSEKMVKAIKKLEIEIEARRLIVRKDRHIWKDVGERQKVLDWLLFYNPLWLRIGLETVFGELISLEDNSDVMGLAVFILNRLLWNPDIAAEYRHPTVPHLYRDGHEEALSKFTLKKLLLLVCFLDYAKNSRLIDHDPCLFCKDAEFKASKEILLAFSRDFLSGEGDLSRHLSFLGLPVSHVQTPFDEFDFAVTNLAVDLQCGVRLVRTMELLTQNWNLSKKLRIPAISRLQKIHNVDIVFEILKSRGIQLTDEQGNTILSKDIVDRHREKTLALLWKIAFAFQVEISLNLDQLKEEIDFLKQTHRIKKAMSALSSRSDTVPNRTKDERSSRSLEQYSESIKLLMDWVNAVCAFYHKKVENFTVSFSDGRVLCYLIHHYHPCYVPLEAVCQRTTQTVECTHTGSVVLNSSSDSDASFLDMSPKAFTHENASELHKELLENEKKNFQLISSAVRDLGGIPTMIHHSDMSNTIPDEKVVITYLSFLCARLLDLRKEIRAARLIQTTWRKYKLKSDLKRRQERDKAARVIQSAIIRFLTKRRLKKEVNAALAIQKSWRRFLAQRKLKLLKKEKLKKIQNAAASVIQAGWRRYSTRNRFLKLKYYSIILQSRIRMIIAVTSYKRHLGAAVVIQRHWRAYFRRKQDQQRYKMLKSSARIIQFMFRRWKRRKMQLQTKAAIILQRAFREWQVRRRVEEEKSAIAIQSWYRMHKERRKYTQVRSCVVFIQARVRCFQAQKLYKRKRASILTIQKYYRAYVKGKLERAQYLQKRAAVVLLQTAFRRMKTRHLHRWLLATCGLRLYWRMRQEKLKFVDLKKAVIKLQAHIRKHQQLQKYKKLRKAALIIQARFRAYIAARKGLASYQRTRAAVIVLQSACRAMQAQKKFVHLRTSAIKIQSYYRAYTARKKFMSLKTVAIKLQSVVKMKQARKQYLHLREAALCIQQWYRSQKRAALEREAYIQVQKSCIKLQAFVRGYQVRKQMRLQRKAAVSLQSYFRMRKARQSYLKTSKATVVIQNYYRAHKAGANQRKHFLQVRRAATCLQAAYRGYKVRQVIEQQSVAALKIQTAFRGYSKRMKYHCVLEAAIKIQRWYRAYKTLREMRTRFLDTRAAVIFLQAAHRGWKVRKQLRREHKAAVKIQSAFRMSKARKEFGLLKRAAVVIQQHLRARAAGKQQRAAYVELHRAALRLQATWKGRRVRRQIQRQHACATVIQAYYRMYVQQKKWRAWKTSALLVQMHYRAYRIGQRQRHLYLKTKTAAIILQSAYRGVRVRKTVKEMKEAAVSIQSKYKAYKTQKNYVTQRASAITIQRWYRDIKAAKQQRREYLGLRDTAMKIQAVYRGTRVRRHIQHMHVAATCIQAMFKMHQSKRRYRAVRAATVVIQGRYRAYHQGRLQRAKYLAVRKAVTTIQAWFRGLRVRQTLREMQIAATLIQSHYRRYRQQKYFGKLKKVTKALQQRYRALKARDVQFRRYNNLRHSAVCIQAAFRGLRARRHLKRMHLAATLIQRKFRTLMMKRRFLSLKTTDPWVLSQSHAHIGTRHHVEQPLQAQKAVIKIQSLYRRLMVKKEMQEMPGAALLNQAAFRMHRVRFQTYQHAAVLIQQHYRACKAVRLHRANESRHPQTAVVPQAAHAGGAARPLRRYEQRAAIANQSAQRVHGQHYYYRKVQWAVKILQGRSRAKESQQRALQHRPHRKATGCVLEGFPGVRLGKQIQKEHQAATVVQKHFKAFLVRRQYLQLRTAVICVQRRYRALNATQKHIQTVFCIQASHRGCERRSDVQRRYLAATLIQSFYRMHRAKALYQTKRAAAVVIQKYYRSYVRLKIGRKRSLAVPKSARPMLAAPRGAGVGQELENSAAKKAAVVLQSAFRRYRARRQYCAVRGAAVSIQRWYKAALHARSLEAECHSQRQAALTIQKAFRKMVTRKRATRTRAALRIQRFLHMALYQRRFAQQKRAAITLQRYFRAWQTRREFLLSRKAAVVLQTHFRAFLCAKYQRQAYLQTRSSIIIIQARMKGFLQREKFQKIKESTIKIQTAWRRYKARKSFSEMKAACKIQAWYRCYRTRNQYLAVLNAVKFIQGCFYAKMERKRFLNMRASTVIIQRRWRAELAGRIVHEHSLLMKRHQAACLIQANYKGYKGRQVFLRQKSAALTIQRYIRAKKAEKCERIKYLVLKKSTVVLQAVIRGWLVRKRILEHRSRIRLIHFTAAAYFHLSALRIQRAYKRHMAVKNAKKQISSVICIQALWRGYSWRKKNDCKKIKAIRLSLQVVNREIREENKLYKRTALALHYLLTYKHLSAILEALKHLEVVTRLSPLCCENMAQSGAISKLFVLIRSCNRSVPCMEVIRRAVQVLLNVAKYEKTAPAVYAVETCIDTLLELLQMYREKAGDRAADKGGSIFTKSCCLLAVLLKTTSRASDVRSRSKVVDRIYSLYKFTARKHKMNIERILYKQKTNSSVNIPFIPETPVRTRVVSRLKPDWVLRRDSLEEITNPLHAIQMVMDTLGIPY